MKRHKYCRSTTEALQKEGRSTTEVLWTPAEIQQKYNREYNRSTTEVQQRVQQRAQQKYNRSTTEVQQKYGKRAA
eukprot:6875510-Lingulodinium_polyedra.AAC.1